ncbi:FTR1 family protein [Paenisporosarcina sp. FSL H8-0542]|uniref:FTR1 family protein n=1 Tax=Paenisporosarcina sp. FSL H8-0542 TaxID=2921401 RepID=UPI003159DC9C
MSNFLTFFKILSLVTMLLVVPSQNNVSAAQSFGHLYIAITDAIMSTKNDDDAKATEAIETFQTDWKQLNITEGEESADVNEALEKASSATTSEKRLSALTDLSKALTAYEKSENPVDEKANREAFLKAVEPSLNDLKTAIDSSDKDEIQEAYSIFLKKWTKNERVVREQNIAAYGQIETQMSFMRISLAGDELDVTKLKEQVESLNQTIQDFVAGKVKNAEVSGNYSLTTLTGLLDESKASIEEGNYNQAAESLKKFITIWPGVEGEIRTKNARLYSEIESGIPLLVSDLLRDDVEASAITGKLDSFKQQIDFIQQDTTYSFWDSALILLREGLEALLIISALIAFLKKAGQQDMQRYIYVGAGTGISVSVIAAILMSTLFQSGTIGTSREVMEGYVGIAAAVMMLGVGIWLHSKSTVTSWNRYISKQMTHALSMQSVWSMTFLSFLTVFREGAETVVFYMGIAPKMSTFDFILGIVLAILILVATAFFFARASKKIPLHLFFGVATVFIYLLAFKIIGASLHTLQLTNVLPTHIISNLPVINFIGFYPSVETLTGQVILLILIAGTIIYKKMASTVSNTSLQS